MKSIIIRLYKQSFPNSLRFKIYKIRKKNKLIDIFKSITIIIKQLKILLTKYTWVSQEEVEIASKIKKNNRLNQKKIIDNGGRIASYENLIKFKKSDTLFVLGSGSSINDISDKQWNEIKKHDSIGFNLFLLHSFIPTYYHLEFTPEIYKYYHEIIHSKIDDVKQIPLLINYSHVDSNRSLSDYFWLKNTMFTNPYYFNFNQSFVRKIIEYFYKIENTRKKNFLVHYRGSLSIMISLGILLGYKKIVLMGVDLNNSNYFFHDEALYNTAIDKKVRSFHLSKIKSVGGTKQVHRTVDKKVAVKYLTIDKFIVMYSEVINDLYQTKILIGSDKSLLSKNLEQYEF